jgi:hypothetical protein
VSLHPSCNNTLDSPPHGYHVIYKRCLRIACESCTDFLEISMGTLREGIDLGFVSSCKTSNSEDWISVEVEDTRTLVVNWSITLYVLVVVESN